MIRIALFALLLSLTAAPVFACSHGEGPAAMPSAAPATDGSAPADPNAAPAPAGEAPKSP